MFSPSSLETLAKEDEKEIGDANLVDALPDELSHIDETFRSGINVVRVQSNGKARESHLSVISGGVVADKHRVHLGSIDEIRRGQNTTGFHKADPSLLTEVFESRSFSIIFGSGSTLNFVLGSEKRVDFWVKGLNALREKDSEKTAELKRAAMYWRSVAQEKEVLNFKDVVKLMKKMGMKPKKAHVRRLFKEVDQDKSKTLDFGEFLVLLRNLRERPAIRLLFLHYSSNHVYLTPEEFLCFLETEQIETEITHIKHVVELFHQYQPSSVAGPGGGSIDLPRDDVLQDLPDGLDVVMYYFEFEEYLTSAANELMDPNYATLYQPMDRPLSHYWIAASHNTYLKGDQLKSKSDIEMYITALKRGCKCVELDCWDSDVGPIIYHGKTLTTKLKFKHVCQAIKDYAFWQSPYPVILSIENHCSREQQQIMAKDLLDVFGGMLLKPMPMAKEDELPSPEALKGKILVKCATSGQSDLELAASGSTADPEAKIHPDLANVTYLRTQPFTSFAKISECSTSDQMCSFDEDKVKDIRDTRPDRFVKHNMKYISRVYPKGTRVKSSNYDPMDGWNLGCQLVALNYQTAGHEMFVNEGRFRTNGQTGYVLKPRALCQSKASFDPTKISLPWYTSAYTSMTITVYSARQLPYGVWKGNEQIPDSCVKVAVHGIAQDAKSWTTHAIKDNGFNPAWNATFEFDLLMSEMAVVEFYVKDQEVFGNDLPLAYYSLPLEAMRPGYRVIPLYNMDHELLPAANLFVRIEFTQQQRRGSSTPSASALSSSSSSSSSSRPSPNIPQNWEDRVRSMLEPLKKQNAELEERVKALEKEVADLRTGE